MHHEFVLKIILLFYKMFDQIEKVHGPSRGRHEVPGGQRAAPPGLLMMRRRDAPQGRVALALAGTCAGPPGDVPHWQGRKRPTDSEGCVPR